MSVAELAFYTCNYGVLPAWALLSFAPRARLTRRVVHSIAPTALLVVAYGILLFTDSPGPVEGAGFFTIDAVEKIFTSRQTVVACWIHYLVFDLFVGTWEAREAERLALPHVVVVPCLVLTLVFGPLGLLAFLVLRAVRSKRVTLFEVDPATTSSAP
jgi:hypothetical protein